MDSGAGVGFRSWGWKFRKPLTSNWNPSFWASSKGQTMGFCSSKSIRKKKGLWAAAKDDNFSLNAERSNSFARGFKNELFYGFDGVHDFGFQLFHQFDVVFQQGFYRITSLAQFGIAIAEPRTGFFDDFVVDS